jgi:hypothetical protein
METEKVSRKRGSPSLLFQTTFAIAESARSVAAWKFVVCPIPPPHDAALGAGRGFRAEGERGSRQDTLCEGKQRAKKDATPRLDVIGVVSEGEPLVDPSAPSRGTGRRQSVPDQGQRGFAAEAGAREW